MVLFQFETHIQGWKKTKLYTLYKALLYTANIYRCMRLSTMKEFLSLCTVQFFDNFNTEIQGSVSPWTLELIVQILIRSKLTFHRPSKSLTSQGICIGHLSQYFPITFPCSIKISIFLCNSVFSDQSFLCQIGFPILPWPCLDNSPFLLPFHLLFLLLSGFPDSSCASAKCCCFLLSLTPVKFAGL